MMPREVVTVTVVTFTDIDACVLEAPEVGKLGKLLVRARSAA
ncbi:hypothetical protein QFZ67_001321 [Streptomyces sp. V1I1]|nr:hypothetical protein [Streptomyces sp. V1I1]